MIPIHIAQLIFQQLLSGYFLSIEQTEILDAWVGESDNNVSLYEDMLEQFEADNFQAYAKLSELN